MKAIDVPFPRIINGTTQFIIPVFQRDYSWTEGHCDQLWKDILSVAGEGATRGHFIGSVVYVATSDNAAGFTRWLLIDGQQRLTTLTLLLTALRDHILDSGWKGSEEGPTPKRVEAYFLKNVQEEGARSHKLVLRRHDHETLAALLDRKELPPAPSDRIRENYEFFREQLGQADPEAVYRGISQLIVVDVTLDRGADDPQLIFESLNSTGLDLSQSDLIRNFILMRLPEQEQTRLYEVYWSKIEQLFRGTERTFDAFVRDFLALEAQASKQERADQIYFAFRRTFGGVGTQPEHLEALLAKLLKFARYHAAFSLGAQAEPGLREAMARLRRQVDVPATLVMRLFDCYEESGTLSGGEFREALSLIESFVFRRAILGEQTRGYWQVFANLAYRINVDHPLETLKVGLARQRDAYRFPDDDEFRTALEERDLYGKRVCFDLLDRLENHDTKELTDTSTYSIEHVMPQNERLSPEWRGMLGDDWQEVHRKWLHRLGNLTLTGYNSTYADRPFEEKKVIPGGFRQSSIRLNRYISDQPEWTAREMELRGRDLSRQALLVWPSLIVEPSLVEADRKAEMEALAARRDVGRVPMSPTARALFELLRSRLRGLGDDVIELAEQKSVSYHSRSFFLEVLPRKNGLSLLLDLDFNEIQDDSGLAQDATQWKFFAWAVYDGGVVVGTSREADVDAAMPIVRQAHALASA